MLCGVDSFRKRQPLTEAAAALHYDKLFQLLIILPDKVLALAFITGKYTMNNTNIFIGIVFSFWNQCLHACTKSFNKLLSCIRLDQVCVYVRTRRMYLSANF